MSKKTYIFDLDGVLTDTAEYHYLAWQRLADDEGLTFDRELNELLKGVSRVDSLKLILNHNDKQLSDAVLEALLVRKNNDYLELLQDVSSKDLLPGALDLLDRLQEEGLKIALGSASKNARLVLDKLEITQYFDVIGDGNSVERSKPAPDLFLFVANALGVDPKDCVVIEDSQAGLDAARSAGMQTIAVDKAQTLRHGGISCQSLLELNQNDKLK